MTLPVLDLRGTAHERGILHGRSLRTAIADNVETYMARFLSGGMSRAKLERSSSEWADFIAEDAPGYFVEMAGIAEGSGVPLPEVALLNARYELAYSVMRSEALHPREPAIQEVDGCTSFGLEPSVTTMGHTIIGQNWDWLKRLRGRMAVSRVHGEGIEPFIGLHEAGVVGSKMGVNASGIGLVVNGLITPDDGKNGFTRPLHVRCRNVLSTRRFDKALGEIIATPRTCSSNLLVGQGDGEILNLEIVPDRHTVLYPRDGIVTHANHIVGNLTDRSLYDQIGPHTLYRASRLERLLRAKAKRLEVADVIECLSDRFGAPAAICRHEDLDVPEAKRTITVAGVIIDLTARILYVSDGPPCSNQFIAYPLTNDAATPTTH